MALHPWGPLWGSMETAPVPGEQEGWQGSRISTPPSPMVRGYSVSSLSPAPSRETWGAEKQVLEVGGVNMRES